MTDHRADTLLPANTRHAVALVLGANLLFALVDTSTKWLIGAGLTVLQLAFLRYALHFLVTIAEGTIRRQRMPRLSPRVWALVVLRAFFLVSATIANFVALGHLPLAVTAAILFLYPVLVCLFARAILRETLGARQVMAVLVGFSGTAIILNPFGAEVNWYAILMLYPASAMAIYIVLTRLLADQVPALVLQFNTGLLGTVALAPIGLWAWATPSGPAEWSLAMLIGVFAWAGHELLTRAHHSAEASFLAPYGYSFVLFLIVAGWIVFGDVPTPMTLLGAVFIAVAGVLVQRRRAG
ncbi:MAG: DMT family transporter [Pseudomonadota bacterium]